MAYQRWVENVWDNVFDVVMSKFLVFMNDVTIPSKTHLWMCMLTVSFKAIMIESQALKSLILQTRDKENKIFSPNCEAWLLVLQGYT